MTPSVTGVPPELKGLPQAWIDEIDQACMGDWRRVEVTSPSSWIIRNKPVFRRVELATVMPKRSSHTRKVAPRVIGPERSMASFPTDMNPMEAARAMAEQFRVGIHSAIHVQLSEQVLNMASASVELGMSAVRAPARVDVDPASVERGPRIRFYRGDVMAVVAFASITDPHLIWVSTSAS